MAIGERTPLALIDAPASGRMAVGRGADEHRRGRHRATSATSSFPRTGWRAAGHPGEDAALYDTVRAVAMDLCIALGISHSGRQGFDVDAHDVARGRRRQVGHGAGVADRLGVRAGSRMRAHALTPLLRLDAARRAACCVDLADGRRRLGGSVLAQVTGSSATSRRISTIAARLAAFFALVQRLHAASMLLAYHDVAMADCSSTLAEMAFASRCGLDIDIADLRGDRAGGTVRRRARRRRAGPYAARSMPISAVARDAGIAAHVHRHAGATASTHAHPPRRCDRARRGARRSASRMVGDDACDAAAARQPGRGGPGVRAHCRRRRSGTAAALDVRPGRTIARRRSSPRGARPQVAILREQGVNGQVEMAAAFDARGLRCVRCAHERPRSAGVTRLPIFTGIVACGGFSYGDVLGAGEGWAKSILFNAQRARRVRRVLRSAAIHSRSACATAAR